MGKEGMSMGSDPTTNIEALAKKQKIGQNLRLYQNVSMFYIFLRFAKQLLVYTSYVDMQIKWRHILPAASIPLITVNKMKINVQ